MRRVALALAALAVTLAGAGAAAPRLAALAASAALVPSDDPTVVLDREVTGEFGFENPVVWMLEARTGTVWTRPMLERLSALTDDVRRIPGVVALDVIGLASPNMRDLRVTEEGLEPTYLMGEVPPTAEAIAALRRRIDGDANYAGTLVTRDGRAAMVVANFRADADPRSVGLAALALRDRYRDGETAVWTVGGPVLAVVAPAAFTAVARRALVFTLAGLGVLGVLLGVRAAASAVLAAALAAAWLVIGAVLVRGTLPWSVEAAVPAALVAAAVATGAERAGTMGAIVAAGALPGALAAGAPARALWVGIAAAGPLGAAAGWLMRAAVRPAPRPFAGNRGVRIVALVAVAAALVGAPRLRCSLALIGYGERYLPRAATADIAALRRLFPPPLSLAVRVRGEPGFVTAPEVLHALDGAAVAARRDPAVRSAMSIADVVKMVHRAFNDQRPEYLTIPDDRALVGRYLALAYSPAFRRFLDRAFAETALWVQIEGERPADVERGLSLLRVTVPPGATVDPPAGDGAIVVVMARIARRLAAFAAVALLVAAAVTAAVSGARAGGRSLAAGTVAAAVGVGVLGWAGESIDLVSLPLLACVAVATAALGGPAPPPARLALGLAGAGAVALAAPLPAAPLVAALLLGPGVALLVCSAPARRSVSTTS